MLSWPEYQGAEAVLFVNPERGLDRVTEPVKRDVGEQNAGLMRRDEKPNPGSDGATTSKASCASPPYVAGSVSSGMTRSNSAKEPGQP